MKVKLYNYIGSYGSAWVYDTDETPAHYRNSEEWEYLGEYDLPVHLLEKLPFYLE